MRPIYNDLFLFTRAELGYIKSHVSQKDMDVGGIA
jgi:hypothetical protein